MHDMAAHLDGRGPFSGLQRLGRLELEGGGGAALNCHQNARWRHGNAGWRRRYQNTGWGHSTRHLCGKGVADAEAFGGFVNAPWRRKPAGLSVHFAGQSSSSIFVRRHCCRRPNVQNF